MHPENIFQKSSERVAPSRGSRILRTAFLAAALLPVIYTASFADGIKKKIARTAAHSFTNPEYKREKLPNGDWKTETYALGFGNTLDPSGSDESLKALSDQEMAEILYYPLLGEDYRPELDADKTDLLIVVSWGKTLPPGEGAMGSTATDSMSDAVNQMSSLQGTLDGAAPGSVDAIAAQSEMSDLESQLGMYALMQAQADQMRRKANDYNARLLGYAPEINDEYATLYDTLGFRRKLMDNMIEEIETERYFVILQAYDFTKLVENKEKDLQWMTRFSIKARGRNFNEEFANMTEAASSLFGQDSGSIKRRMLPGKTKLGELEVVGIEEDESESSE